MHPLVRQLAFLNTHRVAEDARKWAVISNLAGYLVAVLVIPFGVIYSLLTAQDWRPVLACNLALAAAGAITPLFHRLGQIAAPIWLALASTTQVTALAYIFGSQSGVLLNLLAIPPLTLLTLGPRRPVLAAALTAATLAVIFVGTVFFDRLPVSAWAEGAAAYHVFGVAIGTAAIIPFAAVFFAIRSAEAAEEARKRLLLTLMPEPVVRDLLARPGETLSYDIAHACVLFADRHS